MSTRTGADRATLLQGTLDLPILRTLLFGSQHGQGIAHAIRRQPDEVPPIDHGSLRPALQRLEEKGWISAESGASVNRRKARFCTLAKMGGKQLTEETSAWRRLVAPIGRVLDPEEV
jgi:transcriptional regulator